MICITPSRTSKILVDHDVVDNKKKDVGLVTTWPKRGRRISTGAQPTSPPNTLLITRHISYSKQCVVRTKMYNPTVGEAIKVLWVLDAATGPQSADMAVRKLLYRFNSSVMHFDTAL